MSENIELLCNSIPRVIEEMNLLNSYVYKQATQFSKKYTTLFQKYGACHNLFNAKLIYSPVMLQESKFNYRIISERMMGVSTIWNFHEWLEKEQNFIDWSRESHEELSRIIFFFWPLKFPRVLGCNNFCETSRYSVFPQHTWKF